MVDKINFEENKPYYGPHLPFSLEGHWQPWYDDRRDYNINAPTYYDYLSNFNGLIKSIVDFVNELAKRDVKTEDTKTVELIKKTSWLVDGVNEIVLQANAKVSQTSGNKITVKDDGLYVETADLEALKAKVAYLEQDFKRLQLTVKQNNDSTVAWVSQHAKDFQALKSRVDLLDGGGWATTEQLEELRKIIEVNREDYESADSGLRLLIANMQKRLDALDGIQTEIDTWNEKVNVLKAETLNVKNIASVAGTMVGITSAVGYTSVPVNVNSNVINNSGGFHVEYNSFTQRINGRITRIERFGFNYDGLTTGGGASINPAAWTRLASVNVRAINAAYKSSVSNNLLYQIKTYAYRYYNNFWFDTSNGGGRLLPWTYRVDYNNTEDTPKLTISFLGLPRVLSGADVMRSTSDDYYTIVTWLDDSGNEYLPTYDADGNPKELVQCTRINSNLTLTTPDGDETSIISNVSDGIGLIKHKGKMYFSDEADKGWYSHPVEVPE